MRWPPIGAAAASKDRRASAQGQLRDLVLRSKLGDLKDKDLVDQLEMLTTAWRGDETEAEGLKVLAHLYTETERYRDAFHVMRTALLAHPNSDLTRKIQDEAAATFDSLFLAGKGDALPAIEALGLFYDFRELTPIGRRGDEMIRRLADRLVAVDLLDQAAELLQHQVDHRLQGAARAQVATRLATIYLMNRKPDRALAAIQRDARRPILPAICASSVCCSKRARCPTSAATTWRSRSSPTCKGREAMRLRADILWAAKQLARGRRADRSCCYGDRWQDFDAAHRAGARRHPARRDRLRAGRGADRAWRASAKNMRPRWRTVPIARAFEVVTAPIGASASRIPRRRRHDRGYRHARGVPARPAHALSGQRRAAGR